MGRAREPPRQRTTQGWSWLGVAEAQSIRRAQRGLWEGMALVMWDPGPAASGLRAGVRDPAAFSTRGPGFRDLGKAELIVLPGRARVCLCQNWGVFLGQEVVGGGVCQD